MVSSRFISDHVARRLGSVITAVLGACVILVAQGCPTTHTEKLVIDQAACKQPDCLCATPDPFKVRRGDTVQWVNTTSARVTITPSVSGAFVGSSTTTVGGVAGVVVVGPSQTVSVKVGSSLDAPSAVALDLAVDPPGQVCGGYPGPRMDVDN